MDREVDVCIVGAGPAGSNAARILADNGLKVLVLEKKQEIGTPKRCAEGIRTYALENVGITPDPRWALQAIHGAILNSPSGKQVVVENPDGEMGYILERKIFEKDLARMAIDAGAEYMVKTTALEVLKDGSKVVGVKAEHMGEEFTVKARLIIAADGVDSKMGKSAGLDTVNKLKDYHSGFQYEMGGVKCEEHLLHLYFGDDVAPKGYVWIFPKGKGVANVGIGVLGLLSEDGKRAKDYLDKFIEGHPEVFDGASPIEINAGGVPVSSSVDSFVGDGIMLVGDAAQQVNPIHGGGIHLALNAAMMAAEVAVKALGENDVSKKRLAEYDKRWHDTDGKKMKRLLKLRGFLEKLDEKDLEKLAEVLGGDDVREIVTKGDYSALVMAVKKAPKLLPIAKKMLL
jgi:digeranylgeranylglycerophospholipid reductase